MGVSSCVLVTTLVAVIACYAGVATATDTKHVEQCYSMPDPESFLQESNEVKSEKGCRVSADYSCPHLEESCSEESLRTCESDTRQALNDERSERMAHEGKKESISFLQTSVEVVKASASMCEKRRLACKGTERLKRALAKRMECDLHERLKCKMKKLCKVASRPAELARRRSACDANQQQGDIFVRPALAKTDCSVTLYEQRNERWSELLPSGSYTQWGTLGLGVEACESSLLIMTANAHVRPDYGNGNDGSWIYTTFFVDGIQPEPGHAEWGQYHVYKRIAVDWTPMNIVQQYVVQSGHHGVSFQYRVSGGPWRGDGAAIQVAVLPFAGRETWNNGQHAKDLEKDADWMWQRYGYHHGNPAGGLSYGERMWEEEYARH